MFSKLCRLIEWVLNTFVSLFVRRQEAAKDAKQKAALSPEDSEESPNAAQVCPVFFSPFLFVYILCNSSGCVSANKKIKLDFCVTYTGWCYQPESTRRHFERNDDGGRRDQLHKKSRTKGFQDDGCAS